MKTFSLSMLLAFFLPELAPPPQKPQQPKAEKCVQIFYDAVPGAKPAYPHGRIHTLYLQNLLGHFPKIQQYIIPIELYKKGQLENCATSFYLGTYYDDSSRIPRDFYNDYLSTRKNVVWMGYNVWSLGPEALASLWKVSFAGLSTLDVKHPDEGNRPGFFKYHEYRGERFIKYGEFSKEDPKRFNAAFEISLFDLVEEAADEHVVSWAQHSSRDLETPYILRNDNHWYIGESPFSFITEEDRYLIFADLLFDMLEEKPRRSEGKKPALFRLEDVHPKVPLWQLYRMSEMLERLKVPYSMTLIPIFSDPYRVAVAANEPNFVPITSAPHFKDFLKHATKVGASFIYHGVSHQGGEMRNPFTGMTGDDFEFWDRVKNRPMARDSAEFVISRLEDGLALFKSAGVEPLAWLSPHYQASPLDYTIFGQLFYWNVGRIIYFPHETTQPSRLPRSLSFDEAGVKGNGKRLPYFRNLSVKYPVESLPSGQFFPFEILGDIFGQRIIPENVGNVQPYMNEQVLKTINVDELIAILKRNRVLRDSWGSLFVHPFRLENTVNEGVGVFPGDTREIERLVVAARKLGYEFIDLKTWMKENRSEIRPEPIEVKI